MSASSKAHRKTARASELTHVAADGSGSRMVDVSGKPVSAREATARALVSFPDGLLERVLATGGPKGPITEVARIAGIQAAKRTPEWIPMCHIVPLDQVEISFAAIELAGRKVLEIRCTARCTARTGVEMEAMVGASAAALAVYDMTKGLDHAITIDRIELLEKRGGKSGHWHRA